ncbi:ATP-binding protein [Aeromonas veronii]|uniref:AAA family ATPase n=1 Tax=Aeromonas veronii TaxID=654 RepID=UPI000206A28D|nr:AAA family ATPase [Aeromonas veronii]AEB50844.1 hypothetical protein B565_2809 [Aeromonas veronii B565]EKB15582.1 hypothetical protein HMPREF1169_00889 [Aeromonas veronii AER397]MBS4690611.1 AAA family ATPase [Aeromonas veronii bv. veronii]MCX9132787.1 ATP-binding protein [Aeromonas veronii]OKP38611.1 hypothetical protein BJP23_04425 [Aeromonas veronii bv. veronii]
MLKSIKIENFKSIKDKADIRLAPITLIFGPNSSGKTSILQALGVLKQTYSGKPKGSRGLVTSGEIFDLGGYRSVIHEHEIFNSIRISICYDGLNVNKRQNEFVSLKEYRELSFQYQWYDESFNYNEYDSILNELRMRFIEKTSKETTFDIRLERSDHFISDNEEFIFNNTNDFFLLSDKESEASLLDLLFRRYNKESELFDHHVTEKFIKSIYFKTSSGDDFPFVLSTPTSTLDSNFNFFDSYLKSFSRLRGFFYNIHSEFIELMSSISYLGPLRSAPERFYSKNQYSLNTVGVSGKDTPQIIYKEKDVIIPELNSCFQKFNIPYEIDVENVGTSLTGELISISLRDTRTDVIVTPSDVGFGIGQLLPILVEGIVRKNSIICVEQPEIHLHPKLQAELADYFISTTETHDFGKNNNQWIIETHSEALLLRLLKRIRTGTITPEMLSVIYVQPTNFGADIFELEIDESGELIDEWPDGFSELTFKEIFND